MLFSNSQCPVKNLLSFKALSLWWEQPLGKNSGFHYKIGAMTLPTGKLRTKDSICLDVFKYKL